MLVQIFVEGQAVLEASSFVRFDGGAHHRACKVVCVGVLVVDSSIHFDIIDCWDIPVPEGWKNIKVAKFDDDT